MLVHETNHNNPEQMWPGQNMSEETKSNHKTPAAREPKQEPI